MVKVTEIFVEIRRKLQACNFFVHTSEPLTNPLVSTANSVITIDDKNVKYSLNLEGYISMEPTSVTRLSHDGNILSFRVLTQPGDDTPHSLYDNERQSDCQHFTADIVKNEHLYLYCKFCNLKVSEEKILFKRVLPLPSSGMEDGDYFCHKEDNEHLNCLPRENDCLLGLNYMCIRPGLFPSDTHTIDVQCSSCKSFLGYSKQFYTVLWNSSVTFSIDRPKEFGDSSLDDFFWIIDRTLQNEYSHVPKVILENPYNKDNLMIWVIEKELEILKIDECQNKTRSVVRKIMYKTIEPEDMKNYENDAHAFFINTSPHVIHSAVKYVTDRSKIVPSEFRSAAGVPLSFVERKWK